ncbi:MAG: hypothetical protein IH587_08265, partial [Anaerolineae bacterium]|nr:hypothetical protein [Anaerolineae bacterium]
MSNQVVVSNSLTTLVSQRDPFLRNRIAEPAQPLDATLPARITKAASRQTFYTIRFLVDHGRVTDAYRAYAYFRWV